MRTIGGAIVAVGVVLLATWSTSATNADTGSHSTAIPGVVVEGFGYPQEPKAHPFPLNLFFSSSKIRVRARATGNVIVETNDTKERGGATKKVYPLATARASINPKEYPHSVLSLGLAHPGDEKAVKAALFTKKYDVHVEGKVVVHGGGRKLKERAKLNLG